jgi:hypothetical protein
MAAGRCMRQPRKLLFLALYGEASGNGGKDRRAQPRIAKAIVRQRRRDDLARPACGADTTDVTDLVREVSQAFFSSASSICDFSSVNTLLMLCSSASSPGFAASSLSSALLYSVSGLAKFSASLD